jgi:hypothetical protein
VAVADGSVVVLAGSQLARVSGRDGRVLGRVFLDGRIEAAWPDPTDRSRLSVLFTPRGSIDAPVRLAHIQNDGVQPESALGDLIGDQGASSALRNRLYDEAAARLDLRGRDQAEKNTEARAQVARRLRAARERDPGDPHLALEELDALPLEARAERGRLAREAADLAERARSRGAVRIGARLDRLGFPDEADRLYDAAARRFLEHGGNVDLSFAPGDAHIVRQTGGELFRRGDVTRALALVETSRRFSSYLDGDTLFYRRYVQWLRGQGRDAEARRIEPRIRESAGVGGAVGVPDGFFVGLDIALVVFVLTPVVILILIARSWYRSRATRHADLHARGWTTTGQRAAAFFTHPVYRLGFVFLSYSSRGERALLLLLGGLLFYYSCVLVGGIATVGRISAAPFTARGLMAQGEMLDMLTESRNLRGEKPWTLRLLAEAHRVRGEREQAAQVVERILSLNADDAVTQNNRGVLAEEAGRTADARKAYALAAAGAAASSAVGRFNQARLLGDRSALEAARGELPHRDRLRAENGSAGSALWALCPTRDLLDALVEDRSLLASARGAFLTIVTHPPGATLRSAINLHQFPLALGAVIVLDLLTYAAWLLTLLALVWLPLPSRPLAAATPKRTSRAAAAGRRAVLALGALWPGAFDLLLGSAARGALVTASFLLSVSIAQSIGSGGFFSSLALPVGWGRYFAGVDTGPRLPELAAEQYAAIGVAGAIFLLNLVLVAREARRPPEERAG